LGIVDPYRVTSKGDGFPAKYHFYRAFHCLDSRPSGALGASYVVFPHKLLNALLGNTQAAGNLLVGAPFLYKPPDLLGAIIGDVTYAAWFKAMPLH
jgi:hypothetical protein